MNKKLLLSATYLLAGLSMRAVAGPTDGVTVCKGMEPDVVGIISEAGGCNTGDINLAFRNRASNVDKAIVKAMGDYLLAGVNRPTLAVYHTVWTRGDKQGQDVKSRNVTIALYRSDTANLPPSVWLKGLSPEAKVERCDRLHIGVVVDRKLSVDEIAAAQNKASNGMQDWILPYQADPFGAMTMEVCKRPGSQTYVLIREGDASGKGSWLYFTDYSPTDWRPYQGKFEIRDLPNHHLSAENIEKLKGGSRSNPPETEWDAKLMRNPAAQNGAVPQTATGQTAVPQSPAGQTAAAQPLPKDAAELRLRVMGHTLKAADGKVLRFETDGSVSYIQDGQVIPNGNFLTYDAKNSEKGPYLVMFRNNVMEFWQPEDTPKILNSLK
jgi:hypothetical protein